MLSGRDIFTRTASIILAFHKDYFFNAFVQIDVNVLTVGFLPLVTFHHDGQKENDAYHEKLTRKLPYECTFLSTKIFCCKQYAGNQISFRISRYLLVIQKKGP